MTSPLVSVILPVYNGEKYLAAAIESVLAQTYPAIEIICINDGSTDASESIIAQYGTRVQYIHGSHNEGIAIARNKGIAVARGEFLAFMDADDLWKPEKISLQMEALAHDPTLDIAFCSMQCFISPELPEAVRALRQCNPNPMPGYISAATLVRAAAFHTVGLFDPQWRVGEFIDWIARAKEHGLRSILVDQVLFLRRIHETNTGVTQRPSRVDYLKIVKASLDRKKNTP